jgi:hypothetical protein
MKLLFPPGWLKIKNLENKEAKQPGNRSFSQSLKATPNPKRSTPLTKL